MNNQKIDNLQIMPNNLDEYKSLDIVAQPKDIIQMNGGEYIEDQKEVQKDNMIGGEIMEDKVNDQLLIEKDMNQELIESSKSDSGDETDDEMTDEEDNNFDVGENIEESDGFENESDDDLDDLTDETLDEDFDIEFDDELEEDVELIINKSETEYTAEDEIIYRDLLHNFRKNPQYVSKYKVNKDTNIVQLPEHIVKLSKIVDDVIYFKNVNYSNKKLEEIPVIELLNNEKYPIVSNNRLIPVVNDLRRIFKKVFKEDDDVFTNFEYFENQNTYFNNEKEYQPIIFGGIKGIEEYKRNRGSNILWRKDYVNIDDDIIERRKLDNDDYLQINGYYCQYNESVSKWTYDKKGNYVPKEDPYIFRFVDDNSCINTNQPNKKFLFDNRQDILRYENIDVDNDDFKIKTDCGIAEKDKRILNPRTLLGPNFGVTFDENDNLQFTKNFDGENINIAGYLLLSNKYKDFNSFLKDKNANDIVLINNEDNDYIDNIFDLENEENLFLDLSINEDQEQQESNLSLVDRYPSLIPDVKKLNKMISKKYKNKIVDISSINKIYKRYGINFDMLYKDSSYELLNIAQNNIFNTIDSIVNKNEENQEIIDKLSKKIDNYKNEREYKILNNEVIDNKLFAQYSDSYIDRDKHIDLEENRFKWLKKNKYVKKLFYLDNISKEVNQQNKKILENEIKLLELEIKKYDNEKYDNVNRINYNENELIEHKLGDFLNDKIKLENNEISLKEYKNKLYFEDLKLKKHHLEERLEIFNDYMNVDEKIKNVKDIINLQEKNKIFKESLEKNIYHKIKLSDIDETSSELTKEEENKENIKEIFGSLFETNYDTAIKIDSNEGLKIVDMSTKQVSKEFVTKEYQDRINIQEEDNFLLILKKNPLIEYKTIFPWIKTAYHISVIENIKNFIIKLNMNMTKKNVEKLVLSITKKYDLLPDPVIEKQKYISFFRQNNKPIDMGLIRNIVEDRIDKRKAGIIIARLLIDIETNIPSYSFKTTFIPKRSKNVQDRVIDVIHFKAGNEINYLVDVGSVTAELGKKGKLMENTQAESLKEIKAIAEEYYEMYKNEPEIEKLYELRKIEDERLEKIGMYKETVSKYLNHGFDMVVDNPKETQTEINKTLLKELISKNKYKDYVNLNNILQNRSRYLTRKIMQIMHQKIKNIDKREGYNPNYFGEDEINLVPCSKKGTCILFNDTDTIASVYDPNDFYRYDKYIQEANTLNIRDKVRPKYSVFVFPKNQNKNNLNYTKINMRHYFTPHSSDKINYIKKFCIKNSSKKVNTFSGKKSVPSRAIRNKCIDYVYTEDEFMENYSKGLYTDSLYNELLEELNNNNKNKITKKSGLYIVKKEGDILNDINKSSKVINEFVKNSWISYCKINNITFNNNELKEYWQKVTTLGTYKNYYEDSLKERYNMKNDTISRISNIKKAIINFRKHVNLLKNSLKTWENDYKFKRFSDDALMCDFTINQSDRKMIVGNNMQIVKPILYRRKIKDSGISTLKNIHLEYLDEYTKYKKLFKSHHFKNNLDILDKLTGSISKEDSNKFTINENGDLLLLRLIQEFNDLVETGNRMDEENDDSEISFNKIANKFCIDFINWTISKTEILDHSFNDISQMKRQLNFIVNTKKEVISREEMEIQRIYQETGYVSNKLQDADDILNTENDYLEEAKEELGLTNSTIENYGELSSHAEKLRMEYQGMSYYGNVDYSISNDDDYVDDENIMNIFEGETEE